MKTVEVYRPRPEDEKYWPPDVYTSEDTIRVDIFEDLTIGLRQVFEE